MVIAAVLVATAVGSVPASAQDRPGSADHPVLSRYPGSRIQGYEQVDYGKYLLVLGVGAEGPGASRTIEGRVTKISYRHPDGRSSFEIYTNYAQALKAAGFQTLWTCEGPACGRAVDWTRVNGLTAAGGPATVRYLTVRGKVDDRTVTIAMAVNTTSSSVHVVESNTMDEGLITASAAELAEGLDRDGHIAVHNIFFDTGRSDLKSESKAALDEIARLLKERPALQLLVVGHTDSTGTLESNMKLSVDRAAAVVRALVRDYGVATSRLTPQGVGPLSPMATNRTDDGRAKNRRVDLVER
jgi:outer membrane protein OmpA-like peptidoglycan-associated protein